MSLSDESTTHVPSRPPWLLDCGECKWWGKHIPTGKLMKLRLTHNSDIKSTCHNGASDYYNKQVPYYNRTCSRYERRNTDYPTRGDNG